MPRRPYWACQVESRGLYPHDTGCNAGRSTRHFTRRLAAFKSTSRAHVTCLSAAALIKSFSALVNGMLSASVRRSSGFLGGLAMP